MSWSARHEEEHEREQERIRPPETEPAVEDAAAPLHQLAADVGNRAFGASVAREASGILPSGQVAPQVEQTISGTRGGGATLDSGVQSRLGESLGDLSDVRVHTDDTADHLNRAVSARAFATGADVYFARGEYSPGSADGDRLIAHELAHVAQQRGAPAGGPLTVSEPGDSLEQEADRVADEVT